MKTSKPIQNSGDEALPFSFRQAEVTEEQIRTHWLRIQKSIEDQLPETDGKSGDDPE